MCGVVGIIDQNTSIEESRKFLTAMLSRISHRGPDECGIYLGAGIGLGNVRLSIIDIVGGQQPMSSPDKIFWIVYNGEIFNYKELRAELIAKGRRFKTSSDTEVVLQLFQEYGEECLHKLNGQFVFAIWNNVDKELFIARDRIGIRPLFYFFEKGTFIFASEIKSILEFPHYTSEIDPQVFSQIFTFWTCLTPATLFKNIYELQPGYYLRLKDGKKNLINYWNINFQGKFSSLKLETAVEKLDELLGDAVKIRLRSDVPVAAYLSGGLDSSITTAYIKKYEPEQLRTYSIGFSEAEFDESRYQNEVSGFFGTRHNSFTCSSYDIANAFPSVIWHTETPLVRTAPAPMYLLSKKVREENIKVVITGEGADEFFGGYDIFKENSIRHFWAQQPKSKIRPLLFKKLYPYIPLIYNMKPQVLGYIFGYKLNETESNLYSHLLRWHNTSSIRQYFSDEISNAQTGTDMFEKIEGILPARFEYLTNLEKAQWLETRIFLSGYLLSSQGDRMAMANSVEGRYPFLDYRVMEFSASLPDEFKLKGFNEKYILKKLIDGKIPQSVIQRQKQAYRAPILSTFFINPPDYVRSILSEESIVKSGLFNFDRVNLLFQKAKEGKTMSEIDGMAITGIVSSQLFSKIFIEKDNAFKPSLNLLQPKIYYQN